MSVLRFPNQGKQITEKNLSGEQNDVREVLEQIKLEQELTVELTDKNAIDNAAVNATTPHDDVSSKYKFASTQKILEPFLKRGFHVDSIQGGKNPSSVHMVKLRHPDLRIDNNNIPEIVIINSHDRTKSLSISLGIFRFICLNGMLLGKTFESVNIRHIGSEFYNDIDKGIDKIVAQLEKLTTTVRNMQNINLTRSEIEKLSRKCFEFKLRNIDFAEIDLESSLRAQRSEDKTNDLYTVMNLVQEKLIRGGIHYISENEILDNDDGSTIGFDPKFKTTRKTDSVLENIKLNDFCFETFYNHVA